MPPDPNEKPVSVPLGKRVDNAWRSATSPVRSTPDFVILGTQRGGTTSLYSWLSSHPDMTPARKKEIHYFDVHYHRGPWWYRSQFPIARPGVVTGEASPYMLFHPLAPERAARDLPATTKFIVLLREPVARTVSHYWYSRRLKRWETEPFERAIALEPERLAGVNERVLRGERCMAHATFSYVARSEYADQLQRWFDAVGRDRIMIVESERFYVDPGIAAGIADWIGLEPHDEPMPAINQSKRLGTESPQVLADLAEHFVPHNQRLFDLLGHELWTDPDIT